MKSSNDTIKLFCEAWNGTRRGLLECGKICASIADKDWPKWKKTTAEAVTKSRSRVTEDTLDDLRLVGQNKLIPELINCRSLAEQLVRRLPVDIQLGAIAKKLDVAIVEEGNWVRKKKFLHDVRDQATARRVIDLDGKKLRTYAEQCLMQKPPGRVVTSTRTVDQATFSDPAYAAFMRSLTPQDMRVFMHFKQCSKCSSEWEQVEAHMEYTEKRTAPVPAAAASVEA